jgi:hypothetical protein
METNLIGCAVEEYEDVVVGVGLVLVHPLAALSGVHQANVVGADFVTQYLKQSSVMLHSATAASGTFYRR